MKTRILWICGIAAVVWFFFIRRGIHPSVKASQTMQADEMTSAADSNNRLIAITPAAANAWGGVLSGVNLSISTPTVPATGGNPSTGKEFLPVATDYFSYLRIDN